MPVNDVFAEAERQLNVCNSCRYCEGYCPVWPALELRTYLTAGDITHLSNLCHDCRDCFSACMYTAPHEFDLNPPKIFAAVREVTYRSYIWPRHLPGWLLGGRGVAASLSAVAAVLVGLSLATGGGTTLVGQTSGSPYSLIPHVILVASVTLPAFWSAGVLLFAAGRYWTDTHGPAGTLSDLRTWCASLIQGAHLRHMMGGGQGCEYSGPAPGPWRRRLHLSLSYGFGLCLISTVSAAVTQEFLGALPPYGYLSVPVITGGVGGLAMSVGCIGLLLLKRGSDPGQETAGMRAADVGLLWALLTLALTGLATLTLRHAPLFGVVLLVHLTAVVVSFALAPYTTFVHWIYRLLAIYKHNLDQRASAPSAR